MKRRAIRDFMVMGDIWPVVQAWANASSYFLIEGMNTPTRLYERGSGLLTARMRVLVSQQGNRVHLEAWVPVDFLARLLALFLIPAEMTVESGGLRGVIPRKMARNGVNRLLAQLGQPPIP